MRPVRYVMLLVMVPALTIIGSLTCREYAAQVSAAGRDSHPARQNQTGARLLAILFVNEMSCPCTREQCRVAEVCLQTSKEDLSKIMNFETIDYELQHEKAKPLMEKYDAIMVPVLVIIDQGGNVLWRCEDFSDERAVRSRLEELIREAGQETEAVH